VIPRIEPWLTKAEIAAHLRVSQRTVERLALPCQKVGKQNRYRISEVERFLSGQFDTSDNVIPIHRTRGAA